MMKLKSELSDGTEPEQQRKLFIGGLTLQTTDEMLKEFYEQWGEIVDCIVMRDSASKRSRGFGFITYAQAEQLDDSMRNRPHVIDGKTVDPKRAVPRDMSTKAESQLSVKKLYVSGIKDDHTEDDLREYFSNFGNVLEIDIVDDKATGKRRGFAFVVFDDYDPVDKLIILKTHTIGGKRCDVKKALSKDEMKKVQQQERERTERDHRSRGGGYGGGYGGGGGYGQGYGATSWNQQQQQQPGWGQSNWNQGYGQGYGGGYGGYSGQQQGWNQGAWNQQGWGGTQASQQGGWGQGPQGWSQGYAQQGWSQTGQ